MIYNAHLDTFLIVANTGSFSKAAEQLYVTPSAIIQQINALESELKVKLFYRSNKGVSLTRQGLYLKSECLGYIKTGRSIQEKLLSMSDYEYSLILGSSIMQKCRVFYDFWVRFSETNRNCTVQLQTIDTRFPIPQEVDFVEGANVNTQWQSSWSFYELCKVPYGIAVAKDHPLYAKASLCYEDLQNYTVILQRTSRSWDVEIPIRVALEKRGIQIIERSGFDGPVVWDASINRQMIVIPLCFSDVIFDMQVKPMDWDFSVPYGFFYRPDVSGLPKAFLDFVAAYHPHHPEITDRLSKV